eukprot:1732986-Rhodomonas_salina.1
MISLFPATLYRLRMIPGYPYFPMQVFVASLASISNDNDLLHYPGTDTDSTWNRWRGGCRLRGPRLCSHMDIYCRIATTIGTAYQG